MMSNQRWLALSCLILVPWVTACFPRRPGPSLAHFATEAPVPGSRAPDATLLNLDGSVQQLHDLFGEQPVVLQLGSHSCPVYRYRRHWMQGLVEDYGERVLFVVLYTVEAHPEGSPSPYSEGEWNPWINKIAGIRWPQPTDQDQRLAQARESRERLQPPQQLVLVDAMDDSAWRSYGRAPSAAFVIDRQGRIAASQVWVDPKEIRRTLDRLLLSDTTTPQREP